jgi:ComF family protein
VGGDVLVPVPVHAERARRRGYDQAVLLAAEVSRLLGTPWLAVLERSRNTPPQFDLGRIARRTNVAGAFALSGPSQTARVEGRWIVLVDDVVTTGSTLVACAETLYQAGAVAVSAVTVARER